MADDATYIIQSGSAAAHRLDTLARPLVDHLHCPIDNRQRTQTQEVELNQPGCLHIVLIELGDLIDAAETVEKERTYLKTINQKFSKICKNF